VAAGSTTSGGPGMIIITSLPGGDMVETMRISSNGYLGINCNAPSTVLDVNGSANIASTLTVRQVQEKGQSSSAPSGTVSYDWSSGSIFFVTGVNTATWIANIINLPTTTSSSYSVVFILTQGATPGYINSLRVNTSITPTLRWLGGSVPVPLTSRIEILSFALYTVDGTTWSAFGQLASYG
jgi:hypothetical protein